MHVVFPITPTAPDRGSLQVTRPGGECHGRLVCRHIAGGRLHLLGSVRQAARTCREWPPALGCFRTSLPSSRLAAVVQFPAGLSIVQSLFTSRSHSPPIALEHRKHRQLHCDFLGALSTRFTVFTKRPARIPRPRPPVVDWIYPGYRRRELDRRPAPSATTRASLSQPSRATLFSILRPAHPATPGSCPGFVVT